VDEVVVVVAVVVVVIVVVDTVVFAKNIESKMIINRFFQIYKKFICFSFFNKKL